MAQGLKTQPQLSTAEEVRDAAKTDEATIAARGFVIVKSAGDLLSYFATASPTLGIQDLPMPAGLGHAEIVERWRYDAGDWKLLSGLHAPTVGNVPLAKTGNMPP